MKKLLDDCFLHDKDRLRHDDAVELLASRLTSIASTETVSLTEASGRILATDIHAPRDIPSTDNAAVDGYAFSHDDHEPTGGFFPIVTRIPAGAVETELPGFSAARIFTGAPMPVGADTVAMQEDCELHEQDGTNFVIIPTGLKRGANRRIAGEDVASGQLLASKGKRLRPQDIAGIASGGFPEVPVFSKLKVGLLSSGDEVLKPGDDFLPGRVFDANRYMLKALLSTMPFEIVDLGICPDDPKLVQSFLTNARNRCDALVTSGGASRGEEDHFINTLDELGKCHMWQMAIKPGRPMGFGQIDDLACFVLPGNPVAAFVCFLLYVHPSLLRLGGAEWNNPVKYRIKAGFSLRSKPDRREFLRGFVETDEDGNQTVKKFERDGSGLISGLRAATGLIEIPEATTDLTNGDDVSFIPLSQYGVPS